MGFADEDLLVSDLNAKLDKAQLYKSSSSQYAALDDTLAGVVFTNLPPDLTKDAHVTYAMRFPSYMRVLTLADPSDDDDTPVQWQTDIMYTNPSPAPVDDDPENDGYPGEW